MSDTDCIKCRHPLEVGEGQWGDQDTLCWSCQGEEIRRLRSLLSSGEKSFGEWWAVQSSSLPLSRPKLARTAFLAGFAAGRESPEAAEKQ